MTVVFTIGSAEVVLASDYDALSPNRDACAQQLTEVKAERDGLLEELAYAHNGILSTESVQKFKQSCHQRGWEAGIQAAVKHCDALSKLFPHMHVGFDRGYSMAAERASKDIRAIPYPTKEETPKP